jgi:thiamine biosynthesis lipoprotein
MSPRLITTAAASTSSAANLSDVRFVAMGSEVHLVAVDAPASWSDVARGILDELDARWSRFRPDSEVSRLNATGELRPASALTFTLLEAAQHAFEVTGGRFDPTVLDALIAAGYDDEFEVVRNRGPVALKPARVTSFSSVELDTESQYVTLHDNVSIDLGGIAKGFAADLLAGEVLALGAAAVIVNLGGDLRATARPDGLAWSVDIDDPHRPGRTIAGVALNDGAVATTTKAKRRWRVEGETVEAHHLIDPRTARPARSDAMAVTVVASEAVWAEPLAKAAFIAGPDEGRRFLNQLGLAGLLLTDDGERRATATWRQYAR